MSSVFAPAIELPLLTPQMVLADEACATKSAVIRRGLELLATAGRTGDLTAVEQALWRREAAGSTDCGFGFAVPHCQSPAVRADSLCLLRLRQPVDWSGPEAPPVRVVFLLCLAAAPGAGRHLTILAQLSRRLMDEDFRQRLIHAADSAALCALLDFKHAGAGPA